MIRSLNRLSITLLFFLACSGCSEDKKDQQPQQRKEMPPLAVETITVKKEKVPIWLEYTSKTEATQRIAVRARVSGRLDKVLFNEGDIVEQGDILFVIEKDSYEAEVARTKAILQRDKASLTLATADVERYKPLVADGLAPRATLEQYVARQSELKATILADEAAIRDAELNLSYTDVLAPASGRIGRRLVDVGNIVGYGENTDLATIVADDPIYTYFNPTEEEFQAMRKFRDNDTMEARARVPDTMADLIGRPHFTGMVDFTDNRVDPQTGTISMRALIDNPEHMLLEGTFVYTEVFVTRKRPFTLLPPEVALDDQRGSYVFAAGDDNKVKRVNIKRGYSNRYFITVPEGLEEGTKVIINGLAKLKEGMKVEPTDVTATKGILASMKEKGMIPSN